MVNLKIKKFNMQITPRKKDFLVVIAWTLVITSIMIKAYLMLYEVPRFRIHGKLYSFYQVPSLSILDMLILVGASFVVSIAFSDLKSIIYGSIASLSLSFVFAVTYGFLYIWFVLDYQHVLFTVPYAWEWALFYAFLNMLWVMFPYIIGISTVCTIMGVLIRGWLMPY